MTGPSGTVAADGVAVPESLPLLPLRDIVVFPFVTVSLSVSRPASIRALEAAADGRQMIAMVAQREVEIEDPDADDLYPVGTAGLLLRKLKLPDDRLRVLVQGVARMRITAIAADGPFLTAHLERLEEPTIPATTRPMEVEALVGSVNGNLQRLVTLGKNIAADVLLVASNLSEPGRLADLAASHLDLSVANAQGVLELLDPLARLRRVNELLSKEIELRFMQKEITNQAREEMGRSQREYFLRQQLKAIQKELGEGSVSSEEVTALRDKARDAGLPDEAMVELMRALDKLERMNPEAAEYASVRGHAEWLAGLPWRAATRDRLDLARARRTLDEDHHGLEAVKERIVEHLAVLKLRRTRGARGAPTRSPLLCFVGPPGVGKTSLGKSIARALGRKFVRASLGGVRDEAEIRGHRRTYVGSMPGRIIQGLRQCATNNPVFMLDEVDKLGSDVRGDPSAALLEVLDPEQNSTFRDHYLGVPFDLSTVFFIATANLLEPIQPAFRDRFEVIRLPGYTDLEKLEIARRHLVPKKVAEAGLTARDLKFEDEAIATLIHRYTREAGLRGLERQIASVCRKVAKAVALGQHTRRRLARGDIVDLLGPEPFMEEELLLEDRPGVATGLALTAAGGEVLFVEATVMEGHGKLILTGQLGEVMRESAQAALSYARAHAVELGIPARRLRQTDIHVHVPAGATPKDGPSAGVTMAAALISALTGRPVDRHAAMTGEITLRGDVLPVGGVKEKVLAAARAGVRVVILPARNERDLRDVPAEVRDRLRIVPAAHVDQVLAAALAPPARRPRRPTARST